MITVKEVFIIAIPLIVLITACVVIGYLLIWRLALRKSHTSYDNFDVLLDMLNGIIEVEITSYEMDVFSDRNAITNANFNNYYKDMCSSIESHISKDFINELKKYISEEMIYTLIARRIKKYLSEKVYAEE